MVCIIQFSFTGDNRKPILALPIPPVMMGIRVFTSCLAHKELSIIDFSKSPGPDKHQPLLFHWLATLLAKPLADIFNNSLATAVVPGDWKAAAICPVFKKVTQKTLPATVQWA